MEEKVDRDEEALAHPAPIRHPTLTKMRKMNTTMDTGPRIANYVKA
jgi:hypothetical protein